MSVIQHRRIALATGTALLALAAAGCSGLGRTAVGPLNYVTGDGKQVQVNSPEVAGCHRLAPGGATNVTNGTLVDMVFYTTPDCTGPQHTYVATTLSGGIAPGTQPWQSFRMIHGS